MSFPKEKGFTPLEVMSASKNKFSHRELLTGFTLIEMMVVVAIITIMTAIVLVNYKTGGQQLALQRSAYKLSQDIRRTQEMAMSAKKLADGTFPAGGYGVYFQKRTSKYIIFAEKDADMPNNCFYDSGVDEKIEEISLEPGVMVNLDKSEIYLTFVPPNPTVCFKDNGRNELNDDSVNIILYLENNPSKSKTISVNRAGLIDIVD